MTALEIRLLAYIGAGLLYTALIVWASVSLTSHHYERVEALKQIAQDDALREAQSRVIAAQTAQRAAETKVETEHELRTQADTVSRAAVLSSMRGLETQISRRLLPAAMANPGAVQTAAGSGAGDSRLADLSAKLNASLERVLTLCQRAGTDRAAIIRLEPQVMPTR